MPKKGAYWDGNGYDDYQLTMFDSGETEIKELMNNLKAQGLVNDYYVLEYLYRTSINLSDDKISDTVEKMIQNGIYVKQNGALQAEIRSYYIGGDAYNKLLERAGISELKEDEVIIANNIGIETKYGKTLKLTDFKVGDKYTAIYNGEQMTFTIAGIVDDLEPYFPYNLSSYNENNQANFYIDQIVNKETAMKIPMNKSATFQNVFIDTDKVFELEEAINKINSTKARNEMPITGINTYKEKMANESQEMIKPIIAYSFVVFISVISILNIFNTILSSIYSRKREIAMLKSMGMSNKGISKMFTLEGIFYGLDSIIYGVLISLVILYIMYMVMIETNIYMFKIPWENIGISALVMYVVIFIAMSLAKRKIKKQNIIDEIRDENI